MNKSIFAILATGTMFAATIGVFAGCSAAQRSQEIMLLPIARPQEVVIEPVTLERNEITLTAEPTNESANESLVIVGTPSETSETADAKTATPKKPAAKKPAKKPTKKPTKKPAKKKTGKTVKKKKTPGNKTPEAKFSYGDYQYLSNGISMIVSIKKDNTARIEINHSIPDGAGSHHIEHWLMTGEIDTKTNTLSYNDCAKHYYYNTNTGLNFRTIYTKGTGKIEFNGKTLNWTENGGNTAYNLKFTKV